MCVWQAAVLRLLLDSELVEPVLSELVTVLLLGCQDVNAEARLLCGECLGELGAIDPGRLDLNTTHTQRTGASFTVSVIQFTHFNKVYDVTMSYFMVVPLKVYRCVDKDFFPVCFSTAEWYRWSRLCLWVVNRTHQNVPGVRWQRESSGCCCLCHAGGNATVFWSSISAVVPCYNISIPATTPHPC